MLVLGRQIDERIVLVFSDMTDEQLRALRDTPVEVMLVDVRGDNARIGVEAPKPVAVHREEVYKAIKESEARTAYDAKMRARERRQAGTGKTLGGVPAAPAAV